MAVTLLDPGAPPRRTLTYTLELGQVAEVQTRIWTRQPPAQDETAISVDMQIRVTGRSASGITLRVETQTVGPIGAGWLPDTTIELEPDGRVTSLSPAPDPGALAALDVDQLSVLSTTVFPAEPVGVGARWTRSRDAERDGFTTREVSTFRLTALEGDRFTLAVAIDEQADGPQTVRSLPGALASYRRTAEVTVQGRLDSLAHRARGRSEVRLEVDQSIERKRRVAASRWEID